MGYGQSGNEISSSKNAGNLSQKLKASQETLLHGGNYFSQKNISRRQVLRSAAALMNSEYIS
jgi:hypothetical protein